MGDSVYKNLSDETAFRNEFKDFTDKAQHALKDPSASKAFLEELRDIDPRKDLQKLVAWINDKKDTGLAAKFVQGKDDEPQELVITGDPYKSIALDASASALAHEKPVALTYVRNKGWQPETVTNADELRNKVLATKYPLQEQALTDMAANIQLVGDAFKKKQ